MLAHYSTTKGAGAGTNSGIGYPPYASWSNPSNVTADDGSSASIGFFAGGQEGDALVIDQFGFNLPDFAVIDGIEVRVDGSNIGSYGELSLSVGDSVDIGTLNTTYGSSTDLWGESSIDIADVNDSSFGISIHANDVGGGDGIARVDYVEITVYWHVDIEASPTDVETRIAYKVYSKDGVYLGELPKPSSPLALAQDLNSAGSSLEVRCAKDLRNITTVEPLLAEDGSDLLAEDDNVLYGEFTDLLLTTGDSPDDALFKNGNRLKVWIYNYWYPNGKLMFSGQINRIGFSYGGGSDMVVLSVLSDGLDLANFIARGYPFSYTTDVSQTSQNGYFTVTQDGADWQRYGQTWITGGSVTNIGAITLRLQGTATVTLTVSDAPNGNVLGSVTKSVSAGSATNIDFEIGQLIDVNSSEEYFFSVSVAAGQSIRVYKHGTSSTYANGSAYVSTYSGGSGGGLYVATTGDLYFVTKSGTPTTTTTYSSDDPVTEMFSSILLDYNNRGGYITERDFTATGLSLTYTFNLATIYDALKKILELSPQGYYAYIDLGTAEIDIAPTSTSADFTVVRGKDVSKLDINMSIEQVRNYLLFTGGDTGGGVNLFRDYKDSESASNYGLRTVAQTDNRVTVTATADAIGEGFIEENSDEVHETTITVLNKNMDITLLTPGKTIGFKNFGNFIDDLVLQIVRRDYNPDSVTLTLGRLPITLSSEIQEIYRGLLNEQTLDNPSSPS